MWTSIHCYQFIRVCQMSDIRRLHPRLECLAFRVRFKDEMEELLPVSQRRLLRYTCIFSCLMTLAVLFKHTECISCHLCLSRDKDEHQICKASGGEGCMCVCRACWAAMCVHTQLLCLLVQYRLRTHINTSKKSHCTFCTKVDTHTYCMYIYCSSQCLRFHFHSQFHFHICTYIITPFPASFPGHSPDGQLYELRFQEPAELWLWAQLPHKALSHAVHWPEDNPTSLFGWHCWEETSWSDWLCSRSQKCRSGLARWVRVRANSTVSPGGNPIHLSSLFHPWPLFAFSFLFFPFSRPTCVWPTTVPSLLPLLHHFFLDPLVSQSPPFFFLSSFLFPLLYCSVRRAGSEADEADGTVTGETGEWTAVPQETGAGGQVLWQDEGEVTCRKVCVVSMWVEAYPCLTSSGHTFISYPCLSPFRNSCVMLKESSHVYRSSTSWWTGPSVSSWRGSALIGRKHPSMSSLETCRTFSKTLMWVWPGWSASYNYVVPYKLKYVWK